MHGSGKLCDEHVSREGRMAVIHQETSKWILFLDSDDWMEPNAVKALLPSI